MPKLLTALKKGRWKNGISFNIREINLKEMAGKTKPHLNFLLPLRIYIYFTKGLLAPPDPIDPSPPGVHMF